MLKKALTLALFTFSTLGMAQDWKSFKGCYKTLTVNGKTIDSDLADDYQGEFMDLDKVLSEEFPIVPADGSTFKGYMLEVFVGLESEDGQEEPANIVQMFLVPTSHGTQSVEGTNLVSTYSLKLLIKETQELFTVDSRLSMRHEAGKVYVHTSSRIFDSNGASEPEVYNLTLEKITCK